MKSEIIVVIPTYNASETVIENIQRVLAKQPTAEIIIVDDSSPDKTADLIKSKFNNNKNVHVILRKGKGGRGSAVIAGMKKGLENTNAKYFIEMDADLCHDPKYINEMIKQCKKADMVTVSRYLPQSSITGFTLKRRVMSKLMNFGANIMLQVPISDYSNGYRCYTRPVVAYFTHLQLQSKGYVVLSEIAYRVHKKGFIIAEIPFDFKILRESKSNLGFEEMKEALVTLVRLRFTKDGSN